MQYRYKRSIFQKSAFLLKGLLLFSGLIAAFYLTFKTISLYPASKYFLGSLIKRQNYLETQKALNYYKNRDISIYFKDMTHPENTFYYKENKKRLSASLIKLSVLLAYSHAITENNPDIYPQRMV